MVYIYFIVYITLLWILAPIRWSVNLLVRPLFSGYKFNRWMFLYNSDDKKVRQHIFTTHVKLLDNLEEIMRHGDSAKFVGILASVSGCAGSDMLSKYITDNYKFDRTPTGFSSKPFSGDMFAGFIYGLIELKNQGFYDSGLWKKVTGALQKAIYSKPYFTLKTITVNEYDRGFLLRPFFFNAGHFLPLLVTLKILSMETDHLKYKVMYYITYITALIDIIINPTFVIKIWKLRYVQWYYVHSNFLYYYTLYNLTGNSLYKYAMEVIYNRFPYNPDFILLMDDYENLDIVLDFIEDYTTQQDIMECYKDELEDFEYTLQNHYGKTKEEVYNIKDLIRFRLDNAKFEEYITILPPRLNRKDYQWEKSMVKHEWKNTPMAGIDLVHIGIRYIAQNPLYGR